MRKRRPSPDESTAHHESGHVLVGHLVGFVISSSTIVDGGGRTRGCTSSHWPKQQIFQGVVDFDPSQRPTDDSPLPERLTYLYAGVVAQRLLCEQWGVSSESVRLGRDIAIEARGNVQHLPKEEQIKELDSAEKRAMELLSDPQNWQILESIAAKLLECRSLTGPSLLELLLR